MRFRSLIRIILIGGSLGACVSQYTSPGGEVENTSTEPSSSPSSESSEEPRSEATSSESPSSKASDTGDESLREPTEASGTCDDQSCVSTSDCCKGYQCGFDPERSKVIRYCLAQ